MLRLIDRFERWGRCVLGPLTALLFSVVAFPAVAGDGARPKASKPWAAQVTYVVDGDSIWVRSEVDGLRRKLRLSGVDAPEICQSHGASSRAALQALVQGQRILVHVRAYDRYARGIASIERVSDGLDIVGALVAEGWAWSEDYRGRKGKYWREQAEARAGRKGMFAKGQPETPAAFRKRHGSCSLKRK
ncbi:thermonuclease family protein [Ottowia caeni]|uniref:thermonuclease family protein n=1 Tax=Ottowia caeni TaxID=2870339 RepID=UPI001E4BAF9C|nr:thermonuclease family protein [Ottowia caeni]